MKLKELLDICYEDVKVIARDDDESYDGIAKDCPAHMFDNEIVRVFESFNHIVAETRAPEVETMTWQQLADEIEKMPEWARRMPAMVYIDPCKDYTPDVSHCISGMGTYYGSKNPGEIKDDGVDFAFIDLDAPLNY